MKASAQLVQFLRNWEGPPSFVPRRDPANHAVCDIGYGHVCDCDHPMVTQEWCDQTLRSDVDQFADDVEELIKVGLAQHEFDAVVSFAFNLGTGSLRTSTLLRKLNAMDFDGAADEFARWTRANGKVVQGLVKRRAAERAIFVNADYSKQP